ncbi:hypothetical protein EDC04DRAFT_3087867 [Pisolithus marmoratus]|nr:hypothetical protein EDC04DRAFT_3087867 [Pisolithus marmoratus]
MMVSETIADQKGSQGMCDFFRCTVRGSRLPVRHYPWSRDHTISLGPRSYQSSHSPYLNGYDQYDSMSTARLEITTIMVLRDDLTPIAGGTNMCRHTGYSISATKDATIDINLGLRSHARLEEVEKYGKCNGKCGRVTNPRRMYRRVLNDAPTDDGELCGGDDRLDDEYRYWSLEAADALHWSCTDRLLAHPQPIQPPFSKEECQELLRLLNDPSQQATLSYTRMIARVLLRAASSQFQTAQTAPARHYRLTHIKADPDTAHRDRDIDRYTVPWHPTLSAIILSASVTLISFPGLDSIARIGGPVAISCSVLSMVTSVLSIFRYEAEMAQGSAAVHHAAAAAREGFVFLPDSSLASSSTLSGPRQSISRMQFDEYARWMGVGVLGALTGVLIASVVVSKR